MFMHLSKHHGLGNDFLVALEATNGPLPNDPGLARALCDRRTGIGADGLIWGAASTDAPDEADVSFRLHNADGTEAEISGNGLRCLVQAHLRATDQTEGTVTVATPGGVRRAVATATSDPLVLSISAEMGPVSPGPELPAVVGELGFDQAATGSVGNPHVVLMGPGSLAPDVASIDLTKVGRRVEDAVPGGANVHVIELDGPDRLTLRAWERGVGITEACGSGATVAAWVARSWGLVGDTVTVRMPGGDAVVELNEVGASLVGPATYVADVETP